MITGKFTLDLQPMEGLKQSLINRIVRKAVTEASKPIRGAVKTGAQSIAKTGFMAKSISYKTKTYNNNVTLIIGPRTQYRVTLGTITRGPHKGSSKIYAPSKIAGLVEKGTRRSKAQPFIGPAYDSQRQSFADQVSDLIKQGIEAQLAKA